MEAREAKEIEGSQECSMFKQQQEDEERTNGAREARDALSKPRNIPRNLNKPNKKTGSLKEATEFFKEDNEAMRKPRNHQGN